LSGFKAPVVGHFFVPLSVSGSYAYRVDKRWWLR